MPKFSVIIPSHNGENHIRKAIQSVREQMFEDYELIVVCDACTDKTHEIAEEYGATVVSVNHERDGLSRNEGLEIATGEWIIFLDDDDWFLHNYVFSMLNDVVGKQEEQVLNFSFLEKNYGYREQKPDMLYVMCWCRCCRRDFIGDTRFNGLPYGSDRQFFMDLMAKQPTIAFWNTPMYYYNADWRSWKNYIKSGEYA